ncbi:MAG: SMP-30/gluconolactonase/LRE family protein [Anaerolineales bacterium]|nr:SMP-30/gluconolactonase/LRE family protein [Anaerolineales bacterium]MDW8228109.1 SMP-30/gluconolactonase/LRE family protein [Anaerolineales bacterium]
MELLLNAGADLGEGPAWDARRGVLYWVDIHLGCLHTFDLASGHDSCQEIGEPIGCVAPTRQGHLLLALRSGIWTLHLLTGTRTLLAVPEHIPGNRFNDGKCDPAGRFLAGTMDDAEREASGSLYSLSPDGHLQTLLTGLRISNGLTWSPDYRLFYFIDTPTRLVMAYDYDLETGKIANPRPVIHVPEALGWPDGMTSDREGMLWIALWGGAAVTRWNPASGQMLASYLVPALNVTSCIFGGPTLSDLYITSARHGMNPAELERYPLSGGLFRLQTDTQGLPTFEFAD